MLCNEFENGLTDYLDGTLAAERLQLTDQVALDAVQVGQISGIGQDIDIAHRGRLVMIQNIPNKIAPDESAATGHQYAHRCAY